MRLDGLGTRLVAWLMGLLGGMCVGVEANNVTDACASVQSPNCSCYRFAEGLFVECRGPANAFHGPVPVNSLTIHELERSELTAALLPQTATLRQLQIAQSGLQDVHAHAFDHIKNHLESLSLVAGKLRRVPQKALNGLLALRSLDLESNFITELPSYTFYGLKLFKLVLKANLLERVSEDAFVGLEKTLTELDLSENRLRAFPTASLRPLENLMAVRLSWNEISTVRNDESSRIASLRVLDLASNNFESIPSNCFRPMPSLTTLTLFSNAIEAVHTDAFIELLALEYLDLSHNKIIHLNPGVFRFNQQLRSIDITHNHIHAINGVFQNLPRLAEVFISENNILDLPAHIFTGNHLTTIVRLQDNAIRRIDSDALATVANLTELYLTRNFLETLPDDVFSSVLMLTSLSLDYNHICRLNTGVFAGLKELRELRLDNNRLEMIEKGLFDSLTALNELHLQNNKLGFIEPASFSNLRSLQHVNLQSNVISELDKLFALDRKNNSGSSSSSSQQKSLQIMWLGNNRLGKLDPSNFADLSLVQRIYFNNNSIAVIVDRAFVAMQALIFLDLGQNLLTTVTKHTFAELYQLEELHLPRNRIQTIVPFAFNSLKKLRTLDLSGNRIAVLHEHAFQPGLPIRFLNLKNSGVKLIQPNAFKGLNNLNQLNLEENALTGDSMAGLIIPGLRILRISGNHFQTLDAAGFDKLQSLQALVLDNSSIRHLSDNTFLRNAPLVALSLSGNFLTDLTDGLFRNLDSLNELKLSRNKFQKIPYDALVPARSLSLLDFAGNFIETVNLSRLPNLRELDLRNNKITSLTGAAAANLTRIEVVYLNDNLLADFPNNFFQHLPQLRKLDVAGNRFWQIPLTPGQVGWLNFSGNPLTRLRNPTINRRFPHLEELYVSGTNLTILTTRDLQIFPGLLHLYLDRNRIRRISPSAFAALAALLTLDLSANGLEALPAERLAGLDHLRLLNVSTNRLRDIEPFPVALAQLQVLDLSGNQLTRIARETFHGLVALTELRLTDNWIAAINGESFKPLKKLAVLDLSRNYLEQLPLNVIKPLESQIRSLRAEENPLACGCEQQEVWAWLRDHQRLGAGQLRCDQPPQLKGQLFLELSASALCGAPLLVKLAIQDIQPFSFVVSWQSRNHSGLHGFQVVYSNQDQLEPIQETQVLDRASRSVRVSGLDPGSRYHVCVAGLGPWIQPGDEISVNQSFVDSPTSKCTHVRTLYSSDTPFNRGANDKWDANSVLTRRLGLIVGSCMGSAVFFILVSVLGYMKIKKQRQVAKRDQPGVPPEFISYSVYPSS